MIAWGMTMIAPPLGPATNLRLIDMLMGVAVAMEASVGIVEVLCEVAANP